MKEEHVLRIMLPPLVYLNVTDLNTYNVNYDSYCVRWAPHRAATSYRLRVHPIDRKCCCHFHARFVRLQQPQPNLDSLFI